MLHYLYKSTLISNGESKSFSIACFVSFSEIGMLCRNFPINTKAVIEDADTSISLWVIEVITAQWKFSGDKHKSWLYGNYG